MFLQVKVRSKINKIETAISDFCFFVYFQGRVIIVWLSWLIGGICGVVIFLIIICYCRLMPRHQKSFGKIIVLNLFNVVYVLYTDLFNFRRTVSKKYIHYKRRSWIFPSGLQQNKTSRGNVNIYHLIRVYLLKYA